MYNPITNNHDANNKVYFSDFILVKLSKA